MYIVRQGEETNERQGQTEGQRGNDVLGLHQVLRVEFVVDLSSVLETTSDCPRGGRK